jgi:hypothetical protein
MVGPGIKISLIYEYDNFLKNGLCRNADESWTQRQK